MAKGKKSKAARNRSTEWNVGQPLAFPNNGSFERAAREAVDEALKGPFKTKVHKRKKK